ncbi:MAG: chromate transporter [Clostridia bacterium]|nr:chromate transporter [Clostridia bacterium]
MIYLELFLTFFKIGAFTFGGGYAMLPLVQEAVLSNRWLGLEEVINFIAVSESTPGPFAINMATYVGNVMGGVFGAVCATLGVVLPSFVIILIVAKCFDKFKSSESVKGIMSGLKPAVVGLIASAVLSIGKTVFVTSDVYVSSAIFLVSLILALKKVHPIIIICLSAVAGIIFGIIG